jgi:hypothetical protein
MYHVYMYHDVLKEVRLRLIILKRKAIPERGLQTKMVLPLNYKI